MLLCWPPVVTIALAASLALLSNCIRLLEARIACGISSCEARAYTHLTATEAASFTSSELRGPSKQCPRILNNGCNSTQGRGTREPAFDLVLVPLPVPNPLSSPPLQCWSPSLICKAPISFETSSNGKALVSGSSVRRLTSIEEEEEGEDRSGSTSCWSSSSSLRQGQNCPAQVAIISHRSTLEQEGNSEIL